MPTVNAGSNNGHAPLLWLGAPLIGGYLLANGLGAVLSTGWLVGLGLSVTVAALLLALSRRSFSRPAWAFLIVLAGTFLSWGYYQYREPTAVSAGDYLPREADLTLRVERLFQTNPNFPRVSGFAQVTQTPRLQPELLDQPLAFSLWSAEVPRESILPGSQIEARGRVTRLDPDGELNDFQRYLLDSGHAYWLDAGNVLALKQPASDFRRWCARMNKRIADGLSHGANTPEKQRLAGVVTAMFLGDKSALGREQKATFIASGTMHLFAVSGLHVGIIAGALALLLRVLRVPSAAAAVIGLALVFLYVQILGSPPSALRAFLMVGFYWGAKAFQRKPASVSALLASAIAVLLFEPRELFGAGFQLSYLVVAALLLYAVPLTEWAQARLDPYRMIPAASLSRLQRLLRRALNILCGSLAVSWAAFIFATPLTIEYFHTFAPGAILLNLILIPLASVVIVLALLSAIPALAGVAGVSGVINPVSWVLVWEMWGVVWAAVEAAGGFWEARYHESGASMAAVILLLASLLVVSRWGRWQPSAFLLPPAILVPVLVFAVKFTTLPTP